MVVMIMVIVLSLYAHQIIVETNAVVWLAKDMYLLINNSCKFVD